MICPFSCGRVVFIYRLRTLSVGGCGWVSGCHTTTGDDNDGTRFVPNGCLGWFGYRAKHLGWCLDEADILVISEPKAKAALLHHDMAI